MVTSLFVWFEFEGERYHALKQHPFIQRRCSHHRFRRKGDDYLGEEITTLYTHTYKHVITLWESMDGLSFELASSTGIDPVLFRAALQALVDCGVEQVKLTWHGREYQDINLARLQEVVKFNNPELLKSFLTMKYYFGSRVDLRLAA